MSTRVVLKGRILYLGDDELFARVTEAGYDDEYQIVTYHVQTIWITDTGVWQGTKTLHVSLEWQREQADCLATFVGEYQPAQLLYEQNPDTTDAPSPIGALIGGDELRFVLYQQ